MYIQLKAWFLLDLQNDLNEDLQAIEMLIHKQLQTGMLKSDSNYI